MMRNKLVVAAVIAAIAGLALGYGVGQRTGYQRGDAEGYKRAEADSKKVQEAATRKATQEAAKAANPFQVANPLEGVGTNPFEKAKKVLNPFQ